MAIGDDWVIDYINKRIWNKYAWGQGGSSTVYSVNALYSWLMDTFDEQGAMDDEIPMTAQTPFAYTIVNNWFIDDESVKYLNGGAITQTRDDANIAMITMSATNYTNCVFSDITKTVKDDGVGIGPLLAYDNTRRVWWVRTSATVENGSSMTIDGGTGAGTSSAFDNTGDDLFSNLYTLGTIESGTNIYIYQAGSRISQWWGTGHIDVLLKVKEFGTEIAEGVVTCYARMYTDLYDFYEIDLSAGGRNAVPLATADDLDNQTAVGTVLNYMDTIRIMFVNGSLAYTDASGDSPVKHMVLHGQTSHATAFILNTSSPFKLANIEGTFQDGETIELCEEIKFDQQTNLFSVGQEINNGSGATAIVRRVAQDPQAVGTEGILFVTNVSGTWNDNDPIKVDNTTYAYVNGPIVINTFQATASGAVSFSSTINKDLDNGNGPQPYSVVIDLGGMRVAPLYEFVKAITRRDSTITTYPTNGTDTVYKYNGEFYQIANTTWTQFKKASPFGTFAGGKFFGARGVWIENVSGLDAIMYSLIDANNVTQNPPLSSTIRVVSCIANVDRVFVAESTGAGSVIPKRNQYTTASQNSGVNYVEVTTTPADDCPSSGVIRVVYDYGTQSEGEDIYNYTSINRSEKRFYIEGTTVRAYDSGDRAYVPYIDKFADSNGEAEVTVKYSGTTKYIVTRVRKKGYIPFQVAGSFADGTTTITAIRTVDNIVT